MFRFSLENRENAVRTVLCLGAHCDDIEIGAGGTVLKLIRDYPGLHFHWVVLSSDSVRAAEARASAEGFLEGASNRVVTKEFRNSFFPYVGAEIKEYFEQIKRDVKPDLVLTHYRHDLHQDHRVVCELTWNSFRDHLILEYEIPKFDGDLGNPNCYVSLDEATCRRKVDILTRSFISQRDKQWFSEDTFMALLRLRGVEANAPQRYAEAFYCRKVVL